MKKTQQPPVDSPSEGDGSERRRHERLAEGLPAEAGLQEGQTLKLALMNISHGGVQLGCNEDELQRIRKEGFPALHGQTVEIDLRVTLPSTTRAPEQLEATCRLVYTRRVTQHRFCLGMQFTDIKGQSRQALTRYLLEAPNRL